MKKNGAGFTPLEIQKRISVNFRTKAKPPFGSVFSITERSGKSLTGFTILEMILAIFILTVAVFSSVSLIQQTIIGTSLNQSKLIAYYFAQEEVENIKNIRDTNWLQERTWNEGISSNNLTAVSFLDGSQSIFRKKIDVTPVGGYLEIKVTIEWSERGREHNIEVINHLYNWYEK